MKKKYYKILLVTIFIIAFIFRIAYIIKTPYYENQHDIDPHSNGCLQYIMTIYNYGHLPYSNNNQYYHPPLHHLISAGFLKIINIFNSNLSESSLYESLQFLTLIYSMIILVIACKIFKQLNFKKEIRLLLMIIMALHPSLIILSGSLNNDELCFLFALWSMLRLIKWYKKPNMRKIIFLAVTTGACVMSKISGAIIAIPIIFIFIKRFFRDFYKSNNKKLTFIEYFCMYFIFGCISLSIGLWFAFRNYLLFNQELLFVPLPNKKLYVGNYSLMQRLLPFSKEIFQMYCDPWFDYSIPIYLLKCSLFGEFAFGDGILNVINYIIAIVSNLLLIIISIYYIIKNMINLKTRKNKIWKITFFLLFITNILSYILINIKLPYGCTMDFRYIFPVLFSGLVFIGFGLNKKNNNVPYYIILVLSVLLVISSNYIILLGK